MSSAAYEASQVKDLEDLFTITTDGYKRTALYLHKTTNEGYVVVASLEQRGGGYFEQYHSVIKATVVDMDVVTAHKNEYEYAIAYQLRHRVFDPQKMGKRFSVEGQQYRYRVYLVLEDRKISAQEVVLSEKTVRIPVTYAFSKEYEPYLVCPGPFEHAYDLPARFVKKVVIKVEKE